jgi:hypothetical protein
LSLPQLLDRLNRARKKPPQVVLRRAFTEIRGELDRYLAPRRVSTFTRSAVLRATGASSLDALWKRLASRPFLAATAPVDTETFASLCAGDAERILRAARRALAREIDLLGTGTIRLGKPIDWYQDYKTGARWGAAYMRDIEYVDLSRPSDVKIPWEISRLQWLIPVGQAYLLTGKDEYARFTREILAEWITANPYAHTVNWCCTMEPAIRLFTFAWLFHVFNGSKAWVDSEFRLELLRCIYLHGDFTFRYLEFSDINGNHCTADAAALVVAGIFFGEGACPRLWLERGWRVLCDELPKQVFADGVDFEASVPYHRLVTELFFYPARYRELVGLEVAAEYRSRVLAMARFAAEYSRPDGTVPLCGDADDARALPLGGQGINDHRYLPGLVAAHWKDESLAKTVAGPLTEAYWMLGAAGARWLLDQRAPLVARSMSFPQGGFYVMRTDRDHVFIDCGPVGTGGRGGHGHNDCLAFEAVLDGTHLVTDSGAYLYTASARERNLFRSTACHNTPRVDGQEINRFIAWNELWSLHYDATPEVRKWTAGPEWDEFEGAHGGYRKLAQPVVPVRRIKLDHASHWLTIRDEFEGSGTHDVEIPLHLPPGVEAEPLAPGSLRLHANDKRFEVVWNDARAWQLDIEPSRVSRSYGIVTGSQRLVWRRSGPLAPLEVRIGPEMAVH